VGVLLVGSWHVELITNYVNNRRTLCPTDKYLKQCQKVGENDPGLVLNWEDATVSLFCMNANAAQPPAQLQSLWIQTVAGGMTPSSIKADIVAHLALVGGGSYGNALVAPNSLQEYGNVRDRLREVEMDPFVQQCMVNIAPGSVLASTAQLTHKAIIRATPCARIAPPYPLRKVFD
jgi:hypothetical protein